MLSPTPPSRRTAAQAYSKRITTNQSRTPAAAQQAQLLLMPATSPSSISSPLACTSTITEDCTSILPPLSLHHTQGATVLLLDHPLRSHALQVPSPSLVRLKPSPSLIFSVPTPHSMLNHIFNFAVLENSDELTYLPH